MAYSNPDQAASLLQSDQASGVQDIINTANKPKNLPEEVQLASAGTILKGILKGGKESDLAVKIKEKEVIKSNIQVLTDESTIGAEGYKVVFIHPKSAGGVLVELAEKPQIF